MFEKEEQSRWRWEIWVYPDRLSYEIYTATAAEKMGLHRTQQICLAAVTCTVPQVKALARFLLT